MSKKLVFSFFFGKIANIMYFKIFKSSIYNSLKSKIHCWVLGVLSLVGVVFYGCCNGSLNSVSFLKSYTIYNLDILLRSLLLILVLDLIFFLLPDICIRCAQLEKDMRLKKDLMKLQTLQDSLNTNVVEIMKSYDEQTIQSSLTILNKLLLAITNRLENTIRDREDNGLLTSFKDKIESYIILLEKSLTFIYLRENLINNVSVFYQTNFLYSRVKLLCIKFIYYHNLRLASWINESRDFFADQPDVFQNTENLTKEAQILCISEFLLIYIHDLRIDNNLNDGGHHAWGANLQAGPSKKVCLR